MSGIRLDGLMHLRHRGVVPLQFREGVALEEEGLRVSRLPGESFIRSTERVLETLDKQIHFSRSELRIDAIRQQIGRAHKLAECAGPITVLQKDLRQLEPRLAGAVVLL